MKKLLTTLVLQGIQSFYLLFVFSLTWQDFILPLVWTAFSKDYGDSSFHFTKYTVELSLCQLNCEPFSLSLSGCRRVLTPRCSIFRSTEKAGTGRIRTYDLQFILASPNLASGTSCLASFGEINPLGVNWCSNRLSYSPTIKVFQLTTFNNIL